MFPSTMLLELLLSILINVWRCWTSTLHVFDSLDFKANVFTNESYWSFVGAWCNKGGSIYILGACNKKFPKNWNHDFVEKFRFNTNQPTPMSVFIWQAPWVFKGCKGMCSWSIFPKHSKISSCFEKPYTNMEGGGDTCWWLLWSPMDPSSHDLGKCEGAF